MKLQLAKTLDGTGMYGPIYDLGTGGPDKVEEFYFDDETDWFLDNMVDRINAACDTILDYGDYDYIAADKCQDLLNMIKKLPCGYVPEEYSPLIKTLESYASKALQYNTGIAIEM